MSILGIVVVILILWVILGGLHVVVGSLFNILIIVLIIALIVAVLNVLRERKI